MIVTIVVIGQIQIYTCIKNRRNTLVTYKTAYIDRYENKRCTIILSVTITNDNFAIIIYRVINIYSVRVYRQHIRQPQYQQLKVEGHLRVCGNGEFQIFPLLQMRSQDTNLRRSYETRFQQKIKTKLNIL